MTDLLLRDDNPGHADLLGIVDGASLVLDAIRPDHLDLVRVAYVGPRNQVGTNDGAAQEGGSSRHASAVWANKGSAE